MNAYQKTPIFSILFHFHSINQFFLFSASNHTKLQLVLVTIHCRHVWWYSQVFQTSSRDNNALLLVYMKLNWYSLICLQCHIGGRQMKPGLIAWLPRDGDRVSSRHNLESPRTLSLLSINRWLLWVPWHAEESSAWISHGTKSWKQSLNSFLCVKHQRISHIESEKPFKFWSILTARRISW